MDGKERLKKVIRKYIKDNLDEISTTAGVPGYLTPGAFVGDEKGNTEKIRKMAKSIGYTLTSKGKEDTRPGDKLNESHYHDYKNDDSHKPHQKIGKAISEVNKQIQTIQKIINLNSKLQKEYGITNDKLWKRTTNQMLRLEKRLMELASQLREMRG